jgi:CheY-like chemotaxis protein
MTSKYIVLCEDDQYDRAVFSEIFSEIEKNCKLTMLEEGSEVMPFLASLKSKEEYPGLILLDQNMPRKKGTEVLKELKQSEAYKDIPVVIYSTHDGHELASESRALGAETFMSKPYDYNDYIKMIQDLLQRMA